ncbi:MAG: MFS transporter [Actinobacteria bacterium]|nr:MFS transporter [Actinomycetota bacterium]
MLIALVEVLGLSVWFSASAVLPSLRSEWNISSTGAVWLTASVQIGFVCGALASAALNLADRFVPQRLLAACALGAATCTAAPALFDTGFGAAVAMRSLTGMLLAGVYPVGMKLTASWAASGNRGRTFGVLLAALTIGSALPHFIGGLGSLPWRGVMLTAATLAAAAAVIALAVVRPGPHLDIRAVSMHPRHALAIFVERGPRLVMLGYLGHMWELYALWTWLAMFIVAGRRERGEAATVSAELLTFMAIGIAGAVGCLVGGWAADRFGRPPIAGAALVISGSCCLASPLVFTAPTVILAVFVMVWGAAVIADSGVFSTALSETTDQRYVGTALTAQTATGFLLTVVTIQTVPLVADLIGWRCAFLLLAPGPVLGAAAMSALIAHQHHQEENDDHPNPPRSALCRSDGPTLPHRQ